VIGQGWKRVSGASVGQERAWAEEAPSGHGRGELFHGRCKAIRDLLRGHRLVEEEALEVIAAAPHEEIELGLLFDTLGDDLAAEVVPEVDDRVGDASGIGISGNVVDERLVDLEGMDRV